jgi:hypothetical protein
MGCGKYPRFAAALGEGGPAAADPAAQFGPLLDRILDGLIGPAALPAPVLVPVPVVVPVPVAVVAPAAAEEAADDEKDEDERP